jgi:hypothetical protein
MNGFIDHLYSPLGTAGNYRPTANVHNSQITTEPAKPFPSLLCFQQSFPNKGVWQWRFFSFPRSHLYCPANIPQRNTLSTVNSYYWAPGWRPFHTLTLNWTLLLTNQLLHDISLNRTTLQSQSQSQSQSYFTAGGLPPISSSWRQVPWDPRPNIFFSWTPVLIDLM